MLSLRLFQDYFRFAGNTSTCFVLGVDAWGDQSTGAESFDVLIRFSTA